LFWVGPTFGFGFYRAGQLHVAFVFDAGRRGINDTVKLPPLSGQLIAAECYFSAAHCWFFAATQNAGKTSLVGAVIRPDGIVEDVVRAEPEDGSWLSTLTGKCASGDGLLAATDGGIVRLGLERGQITRQAEFPDTEPFVDAGCQLLASGDGVYVVSPNAIHLLRITGTNLSF
jgi:H/ACA ribonucleoprotein complex subunit 3